MKMLHKNLRSDIYGTPILYLVPDKFATQQSPLIHLSHSISKAATVSLFLAAVMITLPMSNAWNVLKPQ
jgi:hypothetical protein